VFLDETYAGKMTILNELRDAFGLSLFLAGEDPNTRDPATIDAAADQLIAMKAIISGFDSATYLDRLADGDIVCAHAYSTDVLQAKERNPNLAYVLPSQGGFRWIDSLCIPDSSPNAEAANTFVNFYLEPEVSASNAVASKVDTGNEAARQFIPQEILDDPAIFPAPETLALLVFIEDLGEDDKLYDEAWARVREA
jgi:spermidine/putrescine-binding protein